MFEGRRKAVFLDRDGTIIEEKGFLGNPDEVTLLPGAVGALKKLRSQGYCLVVVTNQSGVAKGYFSIEHLDKVHQRMRELLQEEGADVDALYYCPHAKEGVVEPYNVECDCRKPKPGLITRAASEWDIDPSSSFLVGDSKRDIDAGKAAGVKTALLRRGEEENISEGVEADYDAADLAEAANWILGQSTPMFKEEEEGTRCDRCGRAVDVAEAERGVTLQKSGRFLCPECLEKYKRLRKPSPAGAGGGKEILLEVKRLLQNQRYREFSIWNIFGGIVQVAVFFTLFLWYLAEGDVRKLGFLMLAVVFQTMALSFFVLGKKQ